MNKNKTKDVMILVGSIAASMVGGFIIGCVKEKIMNKKCSCMDEY